MKTNHLLKKFAVVAICLAMTLGANALRTTAVTFADLQSQFAAKSASGVRDTIMIGGAINVNANYSMVSAGDTIVVYIYAPHDSIAVTSGTLTIGNKVKIQSIFTGNGALQAAGGNIVFNTGSYVYATTGNTVRALTGSTVTVNGGYFNSIATAPVGAAGGNVIINGGTITTNNYPAVAAGMAINSVATGGTVTINGGLVYTTATGISRGIVVDYNGICIVNGGAVRSDMGGGRGISINSTNAGGKLYVYGGTISALGATGRAIQLDNLNSTLWVAGTPTITGGLEGIMVQKNGVAVILGNPTITGVIGTNTTTSKLYDARGLSAIVATPGQGYYSNPKNVTITGGIGTIYKYVNTTSQASATIVTSSLVYTTDGTDPVVTSTAYSVPVTMTIPSILKVSPFIEGLTVGAPTTFNYLVPLIPTTSAPTPTAPANKVLSIFSDAYQTADPGTNFFPNWGQPTVVSTIKVGSTDNVLKYANFSYEGTELAKHLNVGDMKYMHVDVFTSNLTTLNIGPISANPTKETDAVLTLTPNTWNSFDIPVSTFTGVNMSDIFQIGSSGGNGTQIVYLDNIYFWTDAVDTQAPTAFTATTGAVASDAVELLLNAIDNSGAVFYDITYGPTSTVTTSGASGVQKSFTITSLTGSTFYSFSIIARDRSGNAIATPIIVSATTLKAIPGAPVPTLNASRVISIFSNTYTNVAGTDFYPGWGQSTQASAVSLSGNNAMKYANFGYMGIVLGSHVDASGMNKLHVDIYPIDETSIRLTPISPNHELPTSLGTLIPNQWNSFDIPLTTYTGVILSDIYQFKFDLGTGKTFYMDNLYFLNDVGVGVNEVAINSVKCYPTQVSDRLTVKADTEISQVIVRNLLGQSVKSVVVNSNEQSIDLSAVSTGNYFVTVKLANGQSTTQKIIKL